MERELNRLLEEHKRSKGPMNPRLIQLAARTNGRGLPPSMASSVKWILAWKDCQLPKLSPEEYLSSDPDFIPEFHYSERVELFYPNGDLARRMVTRVRPVQEGQIPIANGYYRVRSLPASGYQEWDYQWGSRRKNKNEPQVRVNDFPPLSANCVSIDMMSFLDMIKNYQIFDHWFMLSGSGYQYFDPRYIRTKQELYEDNRGTYRYRYYLNERKQSKKSKKKERKRLKKQHGGDLSAAEKQKKYKSYSWVRSYQNDEDEGRYIAKSMINIVGGLSHPMYRNLNNEQREMLLSWARAQ